MKKKKREVIFWANQHGQGIVLLGKLAQRLMALAKSINKTPEELLKQALSVKALEAIYEDKNKHTGHWPSDTLNRMRRNKGTRTSK